MILDLLSLVLLLFLVALALGGIWPGICAIGVVLHLLLFDNLTASGPSLILVLVALLPLLAGYLAGAFVDHYSLAPVSGSVFGTLALFLTVGLALEPEPFALLVERAYAVVATSSAGALAAQLMTLGGGVVFAAAAVAIVVNLVGLGIEAPLVWTLSLSDNSIDLRLEAWRPLFAAAVLGAGLFLFGDLLVSIMAP